MSMDRVKDWLAIASNAAVLVGIVFLAMEIGQNTAMMETQIHQDRAAQAMAEAQSIYNSAHVPGLMVKVRAGEELSAEETVRWRTLFRAFNRNFDNQLRQFDEGLLAENIPRSLTTAVSEVIAGSRLGREEWARTKSIYRDEYIAFVDGLLAHHEPGRPAAE